MSDEDFRKEDTVLVEFGVSEDNQDWSVYVTCGVAIERDEFINAVRKFLDAYEAGEVVSHSDNDIEAAGSLQ